MTIEEFAHQLIATVRPILPEHLRNAKMTVQPSEEPYHTGMTSIYVWPEDSDVAPCYYIDQQYANFCEGMPIQDIASDLADAITGHQVLEQEIDNSILEDFERAKANIIAVLIDGRKGRNEKYLSKRPCMPFGQSDIKIIFALQFSIKSLGTTMTLPITTDLMEFWDTTPMHLQQYAIENGPALRPVMINPIGNFFAGPKAINKSPMMVLTNTDDSQGAAVLLYKETPAMLDKEFPGGYYLLPSSVHEWIVVDRRVFDDPKELLTIVKQFNQETSAPLNILADDVFELQGGLLISATKKGGIYA